MLWHRDAAIPNDIDAVILPGGFSYGDRSRWPGNHLAEFRPAPNAVPMRRLRSPKFMD